MSPEPITVEAAATSNDIAVDGDYWHRLEREGVAADFLNLTTRTMQVFRQKGGGPRFVRISARAIRYRRADLKAWADQRLHASTAEAAAAA